MLTKGACGQIIPKHFNGEIAVAVWAEAGCCGGRSIVLLHPRSTPGSFEKAASALGLALFTCNSGVFPGQVGKVFRVV